MGYGPCTTYSLQTADIVSPGSPVFVSATQISNTIIRLAISIPSIDVGGANLSGLAKLCVLSLPQVGTINPFTGKTMAEALLIPGIQKVEIVLTMSDASLTKTVDMTLMSLGSTQLFCAACSD